GVGGGGGAGEEERLSAPAVGPALEGRTSSVDTNKQQSPAPKPTPGVCVTADSGGFTVPVKPRLRQRVRPPGLTLGVDDIDTEVCTGGLTKATHILDHLWLGGREVTGDKASLEREGVTHIVNCTVRLKNFYPLDFHYHRVSWADESGQDVGRHVLEGAYRHIDAARERGKACLVHCEQGTSRSCSLVLGYLMQHGEGMSLLAALEFCQAKRRQVCVRVCCLVGFVLCVLCRCVLYFKALCASCAV
ncbi:unnamed protein product, partial [Discosporangium mesarthrocarpum]